MSVPSNHINIIGAGLAGCEAAYQAAKRGLRVTLFEAKPNEKSVAHHGAGFAELVCSNSLKSADPATAHGLLKEELRLLDSLILTCAEQNKIPAGGALAVDREGFSRSVTEAVTQNPAIRVVTCTVDSFSETDPTIIATGPLTRDEYDAFVDALLSAERVILKDFETDGIFEGCMPVEVMASRGRDALRFGPLKPVGITDPKTGRRPFAVVQLRKETSAGRMYNLVGFQTNLKFLEQRRVFGMIPALKNAEYYRYGVMHKNAYVNAPKVLDRRFRVKRYPQLWIAGQLSGVEGYMESAASGLTAGIYAAAALNGNSVPDLPPVTMLGALCRYIETPNEAFRPMNANFGLLPPADIRDKAERKKAYAARSLDALKSIIRQF